MINKWKKAEDFCHFSILLFPNPKAKTEIAASDPRIPGFSTSELPSECMPQIAILSSVLNFASRC